MRYHRPSLLTPSVQTGPRFRCLLLISGQATIELPMGLLWSKQTVEGLISTLSRLQVNVEAEEA